MESMGSRIKHRRLRGLVIHHRLHPSAHPRRLVRRTRSWGERPVAGVCRWCGEHAASIQLTWHGYCLDAYRVASGQKPGHAAHDVRGLRGSCRRARPQARDQRRPGAGTAGAQTGVHTREPAVVMSTRATGARPGSIAVLHAISGSCSLDWRGALRVWRLNRAWAGTFLPSLCSMDAGDDALTLRDVRTAA